MLLNLHEAFHCGNRKPRVEMSDHHDSRLKGWINSHFGNPVAVVDSLCYLEYCLYEWFPFHTLNYDLYSKSEKWKKPGKKVRKGADLLALFYGLWESVTSVLNADPRSLRLSDLTFFNGDCKPGKTQDQCAPPASPSFRHTQVIPSHNIGAIWGGATKNCYDTQVM